MRAGRTHQTFLVKDGARQACLVPGEMPHPSPQLKGLVAAICPLSFKAVGGLEWKEVNSFSFLPFKFSFLLSQ